MGVALSQNPFYQKGRVSYNTKRPPDENLIYYGYGEIRNYSRTPLMPSDFEVISETFPRLKDYCIASQEPEAAHESLLGVMDGLRSENKNSLSYLTHANVIMSAVTPKSETPAWFLDGVPQVSDFLDVVNSLDRTKHPGFPGCNLGANKGVILDYYLSDLLHAVMCRMIALIYVAPFCKTPYHYYSTFCSDVYCVSVKKEPIKMLKNGRLICSASIVTQVVERLLYSEFDKSFKNSCYRTYSAIGVGFTAVDSSLLLAGLPSDPVCSDVPKFDSTVTLEEGQLNVDVVIESYDLHHPTVIQLMRSLESSHFNKMFILPDGNVFYQSKPGYQPSGRDETSNFNTMVRARRAYAASLVVSTEFESDFVTIPKCAGDDCIESYHPRLQEAYDFLGLPLRDVERLSVVNFCSHEWPVGERPIGTRIWKSLFSLIMYEPIPEEAALSFMTEYCNHADFPACIELLSVHRPEMYTHINSMQNRPNEKIILYVPYAKKKKQQGNQVQKQKPKRKNQKRKAPKRPNKKAASPAFKRHHKDVCSITDPFCIHARAARRPDGLSQNTIPYQVRGMVTVSTDDGGRACVVFIPGGGKYYGGACTYDPGLAVWTIPNYSQTPSYEFIANNAREIRIVSAGAIFRSTASVTNCQGTLLTAVLTNIAPTGEIPALNLNNTECSLSPMTSGHEKTVLFKPLGNEAHSFTSQTTFSSTQSDHEWTSFYFEVSGGPNEIAVGTIEYVFNIEIQLSLEGTHTSGLASAVLGTKAVNPIAITAQAAVHSSIPSIIEGGIAAVEKKVSSVASSALDSFFESAADFGLGLLGL